VSVEKMLMLNLIGHVSELENISKKVVIFGNMQPISAFDEINTTDFTIRASEELREALMDVCYIRPYSSTKDYSEMNRKTEKLKLMCMNRKTSTIKTEELVLDNEKLEISLNQCYERFEEVFNSLQRKQQYEEELKRALEHLKFVLEVDVSLKELSNLRHFYFNILKVSSENIIKLKHNYENIPSIIFSVYKNLDYEVVISLAPLLLKAEADRIFKSLNCEELYLPVDVEGTPVDIMKVLKERLDELRREISELSIQLDKISSEHQNIVSILSKSVELEILSAEIRNNTAFTNEFFYMCGWIPESLIGDFKKSLKPYDERVILIEKNTDQISENITPPTRLKNNFLVRPFEAMVRMYGIPSYGELDPTTFLGLSYMIMFGAMFGDFGQGMVFFIAGMYIKYFKKRENLGGVLARLGISSSIFGLAYGSVFGFEELIHPLLIRPMDDITQILVFAVIFGCGLLIIGFIYSLINSVKRKDVPNGLFGKDGVVGLLFYLSVLLFALTKYKNIYIFSTIVWVLIFIILLALMLFKEPLANLLTNKRPLYSESKGDYFVEEGFGVVETLLSMFSNTLSFVRVGAFALNHVGLFLAFSALANMMNSSIGSGFMYLLGNIVIIGLEGLIVFIQGLRLEYYELFSKYYDGSGSSFKPVRLYEFKINVEKANNYKWIKKILNKKVAE
jgi:V/A-type H+/Na+-transporting ATPase subunit I